MGGNHIIGSLTGATEAAFCVGSTEGGLFYFLFLFSIFLFRLIFESTPPIITRILKRSVDRRGELFPIERLF